MKNKQIIFNVELARPTKVKQGIPPTVFTNDANTVEFIFNVTDLEVPETATAEVNIFMRDGSFFQKDALVEGSEIRYTLSDTEGKHAGMAQIQMTLSYENKRYSTSIFQFKIDSGLNDKVAVEVIIQDWDSITTEARQYLEQLADYGTEFSEIIADARTQVNANVVEGAVENKFNALEAEYAQDITSLKQSDISLTAQLQHIDSELTATTYKLGNLGAASTFKGSDTNANILAKTGMTIGDEWFDTTNSVGLRWNGATWVSVGNAIKLGNEVVVNSNVKDRTLALEKMDFLNVIRTNIHNPATDTNGYYVSAYGSLVANEAYKVSDYIPVKPGQWLYNDNALSTGFYGPNKEQRDGLQAGYSNPYQVPNDVFFVRHGYGIAYKGVLCEGKELIDPQADYGDKVATVSSTAFAEAIKDVVNDNQEVKPDDVLLTFGDSITETHTVSQDGLTHTFKKTNWPYYASEKLGMKLINFGKDGAAYKDRPDEGLTFFQHLSNQIDTAIATVQNPKVIVIACGTNDWMFELGDFTTAMNKNSLESLDRSNLYEAIRWAFWKLKQNYPDALIITGTPIQRATANPWDVEPMTTAIKKMANYYNIIIADAMNESGITRQFEVASGAGRYLSDGLHPNEGGKKLLGDYYAKVIRNNS